MPDLKMLNSTIYLYKLTFIKCSYAFAITTLTWCGMVGKKRHCHDSIDVMQNSGLSICCRYFLSDAFHDVKSCFGRIEIIVCVFHVGVGDGDVAFHLPRLVYRSVKE